MGEQEPENLPPGGPPPEQTATASGEGPPSEADLAPADQPPEAEPPTQPKIKQFAAGFLGWFLVTGLVYSQKMKGDGGIILLVNLGALIFLLVKFRSAGLGMLTALGLNLVIALILGSIRNDLCFAPFYIGN